MAFDPTEQREADREVRLPRALGVLERATLKAESPLRRFVRSNRLNPLPHAGTISVFLLAIVIITGTYLTFFFEFGYEASYRAVAKLEAHPIQRAMRGLHRYSSAALVLTTVVHGWRILVMKRFTGPRRWRWLTGVLALLIVWLAGVTGYWLIWDQRAQALNEATGALLRPIWPSLPLGINLPEGSGWPWLLLIWTLHLLLTAIVAWVLWRHLRNTKHRWLPPRPWMWAMSGGLLIASIVFPIGMLPPADPSVVPSEIPLDPFVMFLLPPLLLPWRWGAVAAGAMLGWVVAQLPWFVSRSDPPIAEIVEENCTGCELCVLDCPYDAISMSGQGEEAIAVVDASRCVGCAICVGSCAFAAIDGFGDSTLDTLDADGRVALLCARQGQYAHPSGTAEIVKVRCTGQLNPRALGSLVERGATSIQVIGCPPGECAYGSGNLVTSERIQGTRRPLVPRRWAALIRQDWTSPDTIDQTLLAPGLHPSADVDAVPSAPQRLLPALLVVLVSVGLVALATNAPFRTPTDVSTVRVLIDHVPGQRIDGQTAPTGGEPIVVEVRSGGELLGSVAVRTGDRIQEVVDVEVAPGSLDLEVTLREGDARSVLFEGSADLTSADRLIVRAFDAPSPPGIALGQSLFEGEGLGSNLGCQICHSVVIGDDGIGPSLGAIAEVAGSRVPGRTAEEYLRQSILDPDAFVVDGYRPGQMLPVYEERLTAEEIEALVSYLLTLRGDG